MVTTNICRCFIIVAVFHLYQDVSALPDLWDLASKKPSRQSSRQSRDHPSRHANDADKNTYALIDGSRDGSRDEAWWSVDLGETARIDRVLCYLDTRAFRIGRYNNFQVETSQDGNTWTSCGGTDVNLRPRGPGKMFSQVVRCQGKEGRHVKISVGSPSWSRVASLHLYEVKAYGRSIPKKTPKVVVSAGTLDRDEKQKQPPAAPQQPQPSQSSQSSATGRTNGKVNEGRAILSNVNADKKCTKKSLRQCYTFTDKRWYCRQTWMINNCAHYCGYCAFPDVKYPAPQPMVQVDDERPVCNGREHAMCHYYTSRRKEDKEYYCQQRWMRKNCKFQCGVCKYA